MRMPEAAAPAADGGDTMSVRSEEEPARPPPEAPAPTASRAPLCRGMRVRACGSDRIGKIGLATCVYLTSDEAVVVFDGSGEPFVINCSQLEPQEGAGTS